HFSLGVDAWHNYWQPLQDRVEELQAVMPASQALLDINKEISIYQRFATKDYTYQYFILKLAKR
nr:methyltransferase [Vibrio anguillarum]